MTTGEEKFVDQIYPEDSSSERVLNFPKIYWIPSDVAPAKTYQGGATGLIYGSLTANKNDLYVLATPNSKSLKI